jgi:DNA-binding NarL/FixJ family response regulator
MKRVNPNSKRQKCFKLFDEGRSNKEVEEALGLSEESVCVYRHQWKKRRKAVNPYINILRLGGG